MLQQFAAMARRYGRGDSMDLSKRAFAALVKQLCRWTGQKLTPTQFDLDAAFDISDEDQNGSVDVSATRHPCH